MMKMAKVLDVIAWIAFALFWISLSAVDSETLAPLAVFAGSWGYLALYAWHKGWLYHPEDEEEEFE